MPLHGATKQYPAKQGCLTWGIAAAINDMIGSSKKQIDVDPTTKFKILQSYYWLFLERNKI